MRRIIIALAVIILILAACQSVDKDAPISDSDILPATEAPQRAMTFMAGYKPQANLPFVGVYVAQEKGFFDAAGLDITIEHSAGGGEHLQLLSAGKIQVTTQDAAVLLKRRADPGLPLVSLALIGQRGQQAFAALSTSELSDVKDWEGRLVGFKGAPPPDLYAMLAAAGADIEAIELINVGFDPRLLTEGKVDVYPVFKSNEPYMINEWGYEIDLWDAADYGVPTLGLAYVTSEETLENDPEMLRAFVGAALHGIEYAAAHPDEAVELVLQYAGPETSREHMRYMLDAELADAVSELTAQNGLGWQTQSQWQALADMLVAYDAMQEVDVAKAFTTQILESLR